MSLPGTPKAPLSHRDIFLTRLTASDACDRLERACRELRDAYAPLLRYAPKQPTVALRIDDVLEVG